ncbi:MAG: FKBP-type peptidyl-prolyl cis-trans isomerase [Psychrobium sp.]|nr:FKBP-type peptidyl-prolyl cis-trans isomerase [Psychrobium sp.]
MNKILKVSAIAVALLAVTACNEKKQEVAVTPTPVAAVEFKTEDDKAAYAIGVSVATYINKSIEQQKEMGIVTDKALVLRGFSEAMADKSALNDDQVKEALMAFDKKINEARAAQAEELAAKAKIDAEKAIVAGITFLAENAKKEGVTTTKSGLQYKVLKAGEGEVPAAADTVKVHYKGTLTDGTEFDSSIGSDPISFPLSGVIAGWTEGLQLMKPGAKFEFTIPSALAYGERAQRSIPANSVLVFEVELLAVTKATK